VHVFDHQAVDSGGAVQRGLPARLSDDLIQRIALRRGSGQGPDMNHPDDGLRDGKKRQLQNRHA